MSGRKATAELLERLKRSGGPLEQKFWAKVEAREDGCWVWTGIKHRTGHGVVPGLGQAHRLAYELVVGAIPEGKHLDHVCRRRGCVNPSHLEPVTAYENLLRGESPSAQNARKTHCPRGHAYAGENLGLRAGENGRRKRYCKACKRERERGRRR